MREVSIEEQAQNAENLTFGDDRLGVMFYTKTVEDKERSLAEGRKCFREREFIKIMVPGDRHNAVDRPVQRTGMLPTDDVLRFPTQYSRFKQNLEQKSHDGTPLALWPQMPGPLAKELEYLNIFTVEQLANLADTYVAKIPTGHQWKQKAAAFVAAMEDQATVNKLQAELAERDNRIETLEHAINEQAAQIQELMALAKKGK
jgi:hypothetical protein